MLKAVIFDFDGVITDSEILHLRAFNEVLSQYGIKITTKDYYKIYLGLTDVECYKLLIREGGLKIGEEDIESLIDEKQGIFEKLVLTEGQTIEGVRDFLRMLEQNNVPMAICSGSLLSEIELILEEAGLRSLFEVIVSADQIRKGKPDPEGFILTLQRLNQSRQEPIRPEQCIVIEDSHWGLEAAKAAGMHTIGVTNSYEAEELRMAEKIVGRLDELSMGDLQQLCV